LLFLLFRVRGLVRCPFRAGKRLPRRARPMQPSRLAGPRGMTAVAVVTVSAAVVARTVKLMRSMSRPGRV